MLLGATVGADREQAQSAEKELDSMQKILGFPGLILQIVMNKSIDPAVRQSGAIYLKNFCQHFWMEREVIGPDGDSLSNFAIHETDKKYIRDNIVESIIASQTLLRTQLVVVANNIIKNDYPHKFPEVNDKVLGYLRNTSEPANMMGSLLVLYQIVKCFEYKNAKEREPLIQSMTVFFPIIQEMADGLSQGDNIEDSLLLQKQILKIFYALIQYTMPLDLINEDNFSKWMEIIRRMLIREVPSHIDEYDECDKNESPFWKNKKWCCHITSRIFERYGSPGNVDEQYQGFADYWLKNFSIPMLTNQLQLLKQKQEGKYVAPRVLQQILNYIETAIGHAHTWRILKNVYHEMLVVILFPLLCFSDDDQDLWDDDPHEYIRSKFDVFEDFISPNTAAQTVLHSACSKRKQVLQTTIDFCMTKLGGECSPRETDGVLHIIGSVADALMKKKPFKDQMEQLVVEFILPSFSDQNGYIRARACWVLQHCSTIKFKNDLNLQKCGDVLRNLLLGEKEQLPVRVEAAIALNQLICQQPKISDYMKQNLGEIMKALLFLIHETENDELTDVVRKMLCFYCEDIIPFAVDMASNIVQTFLKVISSDDEDTADDRAITAVGLLNTLETMLDVVEEEKAIMVQLEGIVCQAIAHVLQNRIMDYYEEVLSLLYSVTCSQISQPVWGSLQLIYEVFNDDGFDFFTEMLPCLHNFLVNDTNTFLSSSNNLEIVYTMCRKVLLSNTGEDPESHAAKLLECVIIQCRGKLDTIMPKLLEPALERLTKEIKTSELRQMCLQVVIAGIIYNCDMVLSLLDQIRFPNSAEPIGADQFVRKWLSHIEDFSGIHDRRVCIMGMCALMQSSKKPSCLSEPGIQSQIMGDYIHLFNGLKKAIQMRDEDEENEDDDDDEIEDEDDELNEEPEEELQELEDDADDVDADAQDYAAMLKELGNDDGDWEGETGLEGYQTIIDEEDTLDFDVFVIFKKTMMLLDSNATPFYDALTGSLTADFQQELRKIMTEADQHVADFESNPQN